VNPKNIPIAEPSAIECGVSAIVTSVMWWSASHFFLRLNQFGRLGPLRLFSTGLKSGTGANLI
jgi:hypothetical protein